MAINEKLARLNILVAGKSGVGKSTLINSVFGKEVAKTGDGEPVTSRICKNEKEGAYLEMLVVTSSRASAGESLKRR